MKLLSLRQTHQWVAQLESPDPAQVRQALAALEGVMVTEAMLALVAVVAQLWQPPHSDKPCLDARDFQALQLGWRPAEPQPDLAQELTACLARHQRPELGPAATIFSLSCPVPVYVGNGDLGGYEADCPSLWQAFAPHAAAFEAALELSPRLEAQWVTVAQVLWAHFRWELAFSPAAAGYFLAKAVTLAPGPPVHYYQLFAELPLAEARPPAAEGTPLALYSAVGVTCFYYAQFCQYHGQDLAKALAFYQRFAKLEPDCLPDNRVYLHLRHLPGCVEGRWYPPCVQEAWAEMGRLHAQQNDWAQAQACLEKAVALRPGNFRAPYEHLAQVYEHQGRLSESLALLARQNELKLQAVFLDNGYPVARPTALAQMQGYWQYAPEAPEVNERVPRFRLQLTATVADVYERLANTYYEQLADRQLAGVYFKKFLQFAAQVAPERVTAAIENQIRLAMDGGDYWQARSLCQKIPQSPTAQWYLKQIAAKLGYSS
jgi:tetratricopeptide (TPR) repeat protein